MARASILLAPALGFPLFLWLSYSLRVTDGSTYRRSKRGRDIQVEFSFKFWQVLRDLH